MLDCWVVESWKLLCNWVYLQIGKARLNFFYAILKIKNLKLNVSVVNPLILKSFDFTEMMLFLYKVLLASF